MKLSSAWWILSTIGLGVIVAANAGGCGTDSTQNGTGSTGGDTSSSSSSSSSSGPMPKGNWLAMPCSSDAECKEPGAQGICATSAGTDPVFQGGPSNGYCTMKCQASGDCPGSSNICFKPNANATEGRCVLGCEIGPELMYLDDALSDAKCQGREDVACYRVTAGDICLPTCGNDSECPADRYCDLTAGVCADKANAPMGKKLGLSCDPMATKDECGNGFCIGSGNGKGFCSGLCTLGGDVNFGDCGGIDNGLCLYLPVVQGCPTGQVCVGAGDVGFCGGGCKAHDECGAPDLWCRTIIGNGPVGYCVGEKACPNGQADCTSMGTTCTDTSLGKYCIDTKWPLGTLAPPMMDGGTDGGDDGGGTGGGGGAGGGMMTDGGTDAGDGG